MASMTMKKACIAAAGVVAAAAMMGMVFAQSAQAETLSAYDGAFVATVKAGATYKALDMDRDGAKDKVSFTTVKSSTYSKSDPTYQKLVLKINGKTKVVAKNDYFFTPRVSCIKFDNGLSVVAVEMPSDNDWRTTRFYDFDSGVIHKVLDLRSGSFGSKYGSRPFGTLACVSKNCILVDYDVQPYATGSLKYTYKFRYTLTGFKRTARLVSAKAGFHYLNKNGRRKACTWSPTTRNVRLYTNAKCAKYTTLTKGTQARVVGVYMYGSKHLVRIQTKAGKEGYINANKFKSTSKCLFKYGTFAG